MKCSSRRNCSPPQSARGVSRHGLNEVQLPKELQPGPQPGLDIAHPVADRALDAEVGGPPRGRALVGEGGWTQPQDPGELVGGEKVFHGDRRRGRVHVGSPPVAAPGGLGGDQEKDERDPDRAGRMIDGPFLDPGRQAPPQLEKTGRKGDQGCDASEAGCRGRA